MLMTLEARLNRLFALVAAAEKRAAAAEEYAERSARLHHLAICRLNEMLTGSHSWPGPPAQGEAPQL